MRRRPRAVLSLPAEWFSPGRRGRGEAARHRGIDDSRGKGVDADSVGGTVPRQGDGQREDRPLGRGVGSAGGKPAVLGGERAHAEDHSPAARHHQVQGGLRAEEHPLQVDVDLLVPLFLGAVVNLGVYQVSGVVDEDVEVAELRGDAIDSLAHFPGRGDVHPDRQAGNRQIGAGRRRRSLVDIGDRHAGPLPGEAPAYRLADSATATGHKCCSAFELSCHPFCSSPWLI